jgi:hypothetical protein
MNFLRALSAKTNTTLQAGAIAAQFYAVNLEGLSAREQVYVRLGIALFQAIVSILAHYRNPDGTPARVPYEKP